MMNQNQMQPGLEGDGSGAIGMMDSSRLQPSMTPILICRQLLRLAASKSSPASIESGMESIMSIFSDGQMQASLPKDVLSLFQSFEMEDTLRNFADLDYSIIFKFLRNIFKFDPQGLASLAMELFNVAWKHSQFFQAKLLDYAIGSDDYVMIMKSCPGLPITRRVPNIDQLKSPPEENDIQSRPWVYQNLYNLLVQLSDEQSTHSVLEDVFFIPFNKCPDLLILGLVECDKQTKMKDVVLKKTFSRYLFPQTAHVNVAQVFNRVWPGEPSPGTSTHYQRLLLTALVEYYQFAPNEDKNARMLRILDLAQDLKALNLLLGTNSSEFALDLACLAARREYLKLDKWIKDQILSSGQGFVEACIEYVKKRLFIPQSNYSGIPNDSYGTILHTLRSSFNEPKSMLEQEIFFIYNQYVQRLNLVQSNMSAPRNEPQPDDSHAQFKNAVRHMGVDATVEFPNYNVEYAKEVEEESDSFFQKIYNQDQPDSLTVDQLLETLKKFQESTILHERQVSLCIIRNLFKEFPYLEQYPEKELIITGEMFGGVILYDFVKANMFVGALKTVLEAFKKGTHKYTMFGQAALNKFKTRLKEFPMYCTHLSSMEAIRELPPLLLEFIEYGKESRSPPNQVAITSRKTSSQITTATTNAAAANQGFADHKNEPEMLVPSSTFQDKIAFIINNLTQITLNKKIEDFKELCAKEKANYWPWIAHYFVSKRVGLENNYHEIYSIFLSEMKVREFSKLVLSETYRSIKTVLRSNKESDSFNDRTLLKNLGQWLGLITLQKNKPILAIELDPKSLLIEAYHKGELHTMYVIPFVTKILSCITKDCVFALPNPWTLQIIFVLTELHSQPDMKLNMKFEVEVLFKALEIRLEDYQPPYSILKNMEIISKIEPQLGTPAPVQPSDDGGFTGTRNSMPQASAQQFPTPNPQMAFKYGDIDTSSLSNISQVLQINKNIMLVQSNPGIEGLIKAIFEKSILDWTQHIVERVISVPLGTIDALVKRSFQNIAETNPEYIRVAGECFARSLVGAYALVNTKEQIMSRISNLLAQLFQKHCKNFPKEASEFAASQIVSENIDLCVFFIDKFCVDRALEEWNKRCNADFANIEYEAFKNKPRVVTAKQMQFFDEMAKNASAYHMPMGSGQPLPNPIVEPNRLKTPMVEQQQQQFHSQFSHENPDHLRLVQLFDKAIVSFTELKESEIGIRYSVEPIANVIDYLRLLKINFRDQKVSTAAIRVIVSSCRHFTTTLMESYPHYDGHPLARARDLCVVLLKTFVEARILPINAIISNISRCFTESCAQKDQTYPDQLFEFFYKQNMINLSQMDHDFASLLDSGCDHRAVQAILGFLKHYLTDQSLDIPLTDFQQTYNSLKNIMAKIRSANPKHIYMNDVLAILNGFQRYEVMRKSVSAPVAAAPIPQPTPEQPALDSLDAKASLCIREWMSRYVVGKQPTVADFNEMVKQLGSAGFLKSEDTMITFFRIYLEFVVERSHQLYKAASKQAKIQMIELHMKMFDFIDPFSALVVLFIRESGKNGILDQKMTIFSRVLVVLAQTAIREENAKETDFNPWAYYRIILFLFCEMYVPENLSLNTPLDQEQVVVFENMISFVNEKFVSIMRLMSPVNLSSFAFAWIDIISHKSVMAKLLSGSPRMNAKTWPMYHLLLLDLFNFLRPYWSVWGVQGDEIARQLYTAQLKIFNMIRLDFPDFLCEYGFQLIQHVPFVTYLMQTRNIILSAIPSSLARVDLNVQLEKGNLQEINETAQTQRNPTMTTQFHNTRFKSILENCLSGNGDIKTMASELVITLQARNEKNSQMLNSSQMIYGLLLFVGQHAVQTMKIFTYGTVRETKYTEFFIEFLNKVEAQVRYVTFSWMVDHLRYPCKDTLFYVSLLQALYSHSVEMGEHVLRALLERELAYQPYPWGLQLLISELHKNFDILNEDFLRMIPNADKSLCSGNTMDASKNSATSPGPGFNSMIVNERD